MILRVALGLLLLSTVACKTTNTTEQSDVQMTPRRLPTVQPILATTPLVSSEGRLVVIFNKLTLHRAPASAAVRPKAPAWKNGEEVGEANISLHEAGSFCTVDLSTDRSTQANGKYRADRVVDKSGDLAVHVRIAFGGPSQIGIECFQKKDRKEPVTVKDLMQAFGNRIEIPGLTGAAVP